MANEQENLSNLSNLSDFWKPRKLTKKNYAKGLYEDCEFYRVPRRDGKKGFKTVSVYRGLFYTADQTPKERVLYRLRFSGLLLLLMILFGFSCIRQDPFNRTLYVGVAEGAALVAFSYLLVIWLIYLTAEREMRSYLYKMTSKRLIRACEIEMLLCGACAAALLIYIPAGGFTAVGSALLSAAGFAVCCAGAKLLAKMEERVPYRTWQSTEQPPIGGERLDYPTGQKADREEQK